MAKGTYVGMLTDIPIYSTTTTSITSDNISSVFTITNGTYYFAGSGSTFTSNNTVRSTTATTTLTALYDTEVSFSYSYYYYTSGSFSLTVGGVSVVSDSGSPRQDISGTYSGSIKAGETIVFSFSRGTSTNTRYQSTFSAMTATTSVQTGSEAKEVARRSKKIYIGINNIARKIKKGYIGVNGVARLMFTSRPEATSLAYSSSATGLSVARRETMAGTVKNKYVLFCGGYTATLAAANLSDAVDVYDETLTRTQTSLGVRKGRGQGVSSLNGFFCLGGVTSNETVLDPSYFFSEDLTKTTIPVSSTSHPLAVTCPFGTILGGSTFAAGGTDSNSTSRKTAVLINKDLTITSLSDLSAGRYEGASAHIDRKYAICAGGYAEETAEPLAVVDCYDTDGTRRTLASLSVARNRLSAAQQDGAAFFAGGYGTAFVSAVEIYDIDLVRTIGTSLAIGRHLMASGSFDFGCVFAGGFQTTSANGASSYCDFYDIDHTRETVSGLESATHGWATGATIKNKFLVGGGSDQLSTGYTAKTTVKVFTYEEEY